MPSPVHFNQVLKDIKSLKIQGAENIAKAGVKLLLLRHDKASVKRIINIRPTEPALKKAVNFAMGFRDIKEGIKASLEHFDYANKQIEIAGSKLIKNNSIIFTHCHSSTAIRILKRAKKQGKRFQVYSSETRPLFQGRKTALELVRAGIRVTSFVDSAFLSIINSIKESRRKGKNKKNRQNVIMLVGTDAVLADGSVINKIGTGMFAEICYEHKIPVYIAADSWKYAGHIGIEERDYHEVWKSAPKKIKIRDPAFERVNVRYIKAIISESGILKPKQFVKKAKKEVKIF